MACGCKKSKSEVKTSNQTNTQKSDEPTLLAQIKDLFTKK